MVPIWPHLKTLIWLLKATPLNSVPSLPLPSSNIDSTLEHVMPSGLTIYGTPEVAEQIASVASEFPEIWTDRGTTFDIPEDEWMPIPLKADALPKPSRVYPVSQKDKEVIDEAFDKLHQQGKRTWSNQPTPFSYPVFVVWRNMPDGSGKGRVVVDIRGLNKIAESDGYPLNTSLNSCVRTFGIFRPVPTHPVGQRQHTLKLAPNLGLTPHNPRYP